MIAEQLGNMVRLSIETMADVIDARREGMKIACELGFAVPDATKIAAVISELGRNILLYADSGTIIIHRHDGGQKWIRITAQDRGPGIENVERVLLGGYSTSKGLGVGLSGAKKIMDEFDIQSVVGWGTTIRALKRLC